MESTMKSKINLKTLLLSTGVAILLSNCAKNEEEPFGAEDMDKFVGTWDGFYCGSTDIDDRFIVAKNSNNSGFNITIHATFGNPDDVTGALNGKNKISVPEQTMGGFPGTAEIIYESGGTLTYTQSGLGATCSGSGYVLQVTE